MTRIAYIGKKQREDAFKDETGITWSPGEVHDIADAALAARMLSHPDVFVREDDAQRAAQAPAGRADGLVLVAIHPDMLQDAREAGAIGTTADGYPMLLDPETQPTVTPSIADRVANLTGTEDDGIGTGDGVTGDGDPGNQPEDFGGGDVAAETATDPAPAPSPAPKAAAKKKTRGRPRKSA